MNMHLIILVTITGLFFVYVLIDLILDSHAKREIRELKDVNNKLIAAQNDYVYNVYGGSYYKILNRIGGLPNLKTQIKHVMRFESPYFAGRIFEASTRIKVDDSYTTLNMIGISAEYKSFIAPHIEIKSLPLLANFPSRQNVWRIKESKLDNFIDKNFALFHGVRTEVEIVLNTFLGNKGIGKFIWKRDFCMAVSVENTIVLYRKGRIQSSQSFYDLMKDDIDYLANIFSESTDTAGDSLFKGKK